MADLRNVSGDLLSRLTSVDGIFVVAMTLFGVFLVLIGLKFRRISLGVVSIFVFYIILKGFHTYVDIPAQAIHDFLYRFDSIKNITLFGDEKRLVLSYLILSISAMIVLSIVIFWVRIAGIFFLIFLAYKLYMTFIEKPDSPPNTPTIRFLVISMISIIFFSIFRWMEDILLDAIVCLFGSAICLTFTSGYFEFPKGFVSFYVEMLKLDDVSKIVLDMNILYLLIFGFAAMLMQRSIFKRE